MGLPPLGATAEPVKRPVDLLTLRNSLFPLRFTIVFCGVILIKFAKIVEKLSNEKPKVPSTSSSNGFVNDGGWKRLPTTLPKLVNPSG